MVSAPTGFGKTVLAAAMIERKKTNTLILVPSVALLNQWLEKLEEFIVPDYPYKKRPFGSLTGKGDFLEGFIDVATVQSLVRNEGFRKKAKGYGMVLVDEVHHMAAVKYEEALRDLSPKYLYGLTATPQRSDERESFIFHSFGPLVELQDERQPAGFIKYYHPRFTKFSSSLDGSDIMGLLTEATRDQERNRLIVEDVLSSYRSGGKVLVLTERIEHARVLYNLLKKEAGDFAALLYGGQDKEERKENQRLLDEGFGQNPFVVISIGKYIGEGFDDDRFTSLFITYPFRWKGMLSQYCGRLQRKETAVKQVDVYDYVDPLVSAFSKMYRAREKGYFELGYKLVGLDPKYRSDILDHEAFESRLKDDLRDAKSSALLFVSYAHEDRLKHIVSSLTCPTSVFVCGGLDVGDVSPISRLPKEIG